MPGMGIQLTRAGTVLHGTEEEVDRLRDEFQARNFVRLRGLLEPDLLRYYVEQVEAARFEARVHEGIGRELWLRDPRVARGLEFLMNDPLLLGLVERITGCGPVRSFGGRVYRFPPDDAGYSDSWHDDLAHHRLVAVSLNLSTEPYLGGRLEIRNRHTGTILAQVDNPGLGDAVMFRLAEELQHRVTPLRGSVARTAFAGWFASEPDYWALLTQARGRQ